MLSDAWTYSNLATFRRPIVYWIIVNIFLVRGSNDPTKMSPSSYWDPKIQQKRHCLSTWTQISDKTSPSYYYWDRKIRQTHHWLSIWTQRPNKVLRSEDPTDTPMSEYWNQNIQQIRHRVSDGTPRPNKHVIFLVLGTKGPKNTSFLSAGIQGTNKHLTVLIRRFKDLTYMSLLPFYGHLKWLVSFWKIKRIYFGKPTGVNGKGREVCRIRTWL